MSFNLSYTAQDLNAAVTKANAAAPQSTTYTKAEVNALESAQNAEIGAIVDRGAKNIYKVTATTSTNNNVTFTVYSDGTIGVKTTDTGASAVTFFFVGGYMTVQPGTYMLSGGISNSVMLYDGADTNPWKSTGETTEKTFAEATNLRLCIRVNNGYTNTEEVVIRPMICTKADWDMSNTYQPYAPTNRELYIPTITATGTMTNSTTIADTGVTVDIPADGGIWRVEGCITWRDSTPTEVQLRVNFGVRTSDYLVARATNANDDSKNFVYLSAACTFKADAYYPDDQDKTIHVKVWGKTSAATGNCDVMLIARKISN